MGRAPMGQSQHETHGHRIHCYPLGRRGAVCGHRAGTGSGDIKVNGAPAADWKLETGSGSIEIWPGDAGFTLDASTGSGTVHTDQEMTVQGSFDRHHIMGRVHGGGPTVRMETGSGDISIH